MIIGTFKEIKPGESRVILTPTEVSVLVEDGHKVIVGKSTGKNAGFTDEDYKEAGAEIRATKEEVYKESDMIVKVKEILPEEYNLLREEQIIFTCIHPAASEEQVNKLLEKKVIGFTAEDAHRHGSPNCEAAGKLGALMGAYHILSINGGKGKLVSGLGGAPGANVLVIGAGTVGQGVLDVMTGLNANVNLMDINIGTLRKAEKEYKCINTYVSNKHNIKKLLPNIDIIYNCVKWPKHRNDHLVNRDMLKLMPDGSVIVDISADVGGAIETYKPTKHSDPTYVIDGVIHYGVENIPGSAPHTVSTAYAASMLPHIRSIANNGIVKACKKDGYLRRSLAVYKGILTHEETSVIQNRNWKTPEEVLGLTNDDNLDPAPKATTTVDEE